MCRIVLIGLVLLLVALMVLAAVVVQEYGWRGFLILVAVMAIIGYVAKKLLPRFFGYMLTRPLRQMGAALRGGSIVVHSIVPCEAPTPPEFDPDDGDQGIDDEDYDPDDEDEDARQLANLGLTWYEIELTVTPPDAGPSEGRIVHREAWLPGLIGATGVRPELERANLSRSWSSDEGCDDTFVQTTPPELMGEEETSVQDQVHGERRLRMRVGVARHITAVTINYAEFTEIGTVSIPRINIAPDSPP